MYVLYLLICHIVHGRNLVNHLTLFCARYYSKRSQAGTGYSHNASVQRSQKKNVISHDSI